jgi:predicted DNA-binding transcriptional regulator AlpA
MDNQVAFTIREFCEAHRICRATFYNLVADGQAPRRMKVRGKVLIEAEAAAEWRRAHVVPATAEPTP